MYAKTFSAFLIATALFASGQALAGAPIDDLDITIRVMDVDERAVNDFINRIELPQAAAEHAQDYATQSAETARDAHRSDSDRHEQIAHGHNESGDRRTHGKEVRDQAHALSEIALSAHEQGEAGRESQRDAVHELVSTATEQARDRNSDAYDSVEQVQQSVTEQVGQAQEQAQLAREQMDIQTQRETVQESVSTQTEQMEESVTDSMTDSTDSMHDSLESAHESVDD